MQWLLLGSSHLAYAQELSPRAYWPLPDGTNALVVAYQNSSGDILVDPSLPITGVESSIDYFQISYQRTFNWLDRTASIQFNLPYSRGDTEGLVNGEFRSRETAGMADARVRLAINLIGAPSMNGAEFQQLRASPRPIIGASVLLQLPTGEYDADKLINLGTNRWSIKPAVGMILPLAKTWLLEFESGVWIFGDNDDFLGSTREQDPIISTEIHLIKRIKPGFWASLDANYYMGGRTSVGPTRNRDLQRNSRFGATLVIPFKRRHALRASYSTGVVTESGGNFDSWSLSYLVGW